MTALLIIYLISVTFIISFYLGQCDGYYDDCCWWNVISAALIPIINTLLTIVVLTTIFIDWWNDVADKEISDSLQEGQQE